MRYVKDLKEGYASLYYEFYAKIRFYGIVFNLIFMGIMFLLVLLSPYAGYLTPVVILVGFSGPVYICSHFWTKIFAKLDPEEEDRGDSDGQEEEQKSE